MSSRCIKGLRALLVSVLMLALCGGCTVEPASRPAEIIVFAAASLTESFTEMAEAFEQKEGIKVMLNFAGSQALATSVRQGTKADVYASANMKYMEDLIEAEIIEESAVFAKNRLVVCRNKGSEREIKDLEDLAKDDLRLITGDQAVPVGRYFYAAVDKAVKDKRIDEAVRQKIFANIRSEEVNVKDIVGKVILGEADAGVVYGTDIHENNRDRLETVEIEILEEVAAEYPIGVVRTGVLKNEARLFVEFVLSDAGRRILKKHGFELAEGGR